MNRYSIGLDLGTSSVKAVLFNAHKGIVAKDSADFVYKKSYLPNGAEYVGIDMEDFFKKICLVLKNLSKNIPADAVFCGLAMASASGNAVLCDKDANAIIDGYSWLNRPFDDEVKTVFGDGFGANVREMSGWGLATSFPLGQLSHIKLNAPDILKSADVVCMATEYVLHRLTGAWGIDVSTATPFYLLDQKKRCWNKDYLDALDIPESKLPPLMECGQKLGTLTEDAADATGLPCGSAVFVGSFDHPTAARGCNIKDEGDLLVSCGTSWVCFMPMKDRSKIIENSFLSDPFLTPDGNWGAMTSLARASEKIKTVVDKYISSDDNKFVLLDEFSCKKNDGGLKFNVMTDSFDLSGYSKENIARALMVGIATELKNRVSGVIDVKKISMCGGPSSSKVWQDTLAEVFGVPVVVTYGAYSGAVGVAMYALK